MELAQKRIKIALMGYGKMGKAVESIAHENGFSITVPSISDICIDFSHADKVIDHVKEAASLGKSIVMGTTGWYDHMQEIQNLVKEAQIGFIYAPNFSIGVHVFLKLAAKAAELFDPFLEFDIGCFEIHHSKKADIPSGTALALGDILLQNSTRKQSIKYGNQTVKDPINEIHFPSLRVGFVPGTHEVFFDSPSETISLSCVSRDRLSFARGALLAAKWISERKGFYSFNELIDSMIKGK